MKKRLMALILSLLCLTGCGNTLHLGSHSLDFYYQKTNATLGAELGILGVEKWYYEGGIPSLESILDAYIQGPTTDGYVNPFPAGLEIMDISLDKNVLSIQFNSVYDTVLGYGKTIMDCCLTNTLSQFSSIHSVVFETEESRNQENFTPEVRSTADYVLEDKGAEPAETSIRVYHSDVNGRYLVPQDIELTIEDQETIPEIIIQQMIAGPTTTGQYLALPEGTELRDIAVDENGLCTVDFSAEFLYNCPTTELMERIAVFAVVNSLTELKTIEQVLILSEGSPIEQYLYMNLSEPLVRDEDILTVVRLDQGEMDATLYVESPTSGRLAAIPVGVVANNSGDFPEKLMVKLLQFESVNGYQNPLPDGLAMQKIYISMGVCYLDFNSVLLQCAGSLEKETLVVGALVRTLTSLTSVTSVVITVNDTIPEFQYFDLSQQLTRHTIAN